MDVSVVIVSYYGRDYLKRCLASIYEWTRGPEFEVIVVDNASRDGTPELVREVFPQVELVARSDNAGFAPAANEGLAIARGRSLFLLNPDAELTSDVLSPMLAYLREHPDIGILAPRLVDADGSLQLSCRAFPDFSAALFNRYSLLTRLVPRNRFSSRYLMRDFDHTSVTDVDWASGACWLLARHAYDKVGPLDEGYFWSIEDVDYCQRVHRAGLRVVYYPEVEVRHDIGGSDATLRPRAIIARHMGMWRYYRSYLRPCSALGRIAMDGAVLSGIGLRCGAQLAVHGLKGALRRRSYEDRPPGV